MSCIGAHDPQLARLANAIAQKVGQQRFHVWFNNSTRLDLKNDGLEIAVPNDFISEWINTHFKLPIQEAAHEVLGCSLPVRFAVVPQLFEVETAGGQVQGIRAVPVLGGGVPATSHKNGRISATAATLLDDKPIAKAVQILPRTSSTSANTRTAQPFESTPHAPRLRHDLDTYVVGPSNQLAYNAATYVAEFPGVQYNPLFIHGSCGLGKTHLLQALCKKFISHHPTKRWMYLTGEEFTNEFLGALRTNKLDTFRRKVRDLDLLVIDDVHFLGGKKATQEEFLHTFNAIEAMGRQVVMASDAHPKLIDEFGESLINRFVSGMVVRVDPPNFLTRCQILQSIAKRNGINLPEETIHWIAKRVTQNVRELEGAINRIAAHVKLTGQLPTVELATEALGDLDRQLVAPVKPEAILQGVCEYFGLEHKDLMSGRRQRTISLARSVAMFLIRKTAKLSFPEIGTRMGKRNHSTVISACRRIERAIQRNEPLAWTSTVGPREEEARELIQRLEEHCRAMN
ncbi:MAG TPA: chromosomal replication initiator protein DnaA [Tepidisphaeraceae bacterium]|nr:chromosomal replication initiator protein DnaA [Tepidisphaeraceae bacterium]